MPKLRVRHAFVAVMLLVAMLSQGTWALAGTTGGISGSVHTPEGAAVAQAKVTVSSPSETTSTTTDNGGNFSFLALAPDSYTVSVTKADYQDQTLAGITVFADQVQTLAINMPKALKTIASVRSSSANNQVKPGTTSDVYSVNAATQQVVSGTGGGYNMNSAYSAIYSQPGVTSYVGNYGWGQVFYIRGSAYSQIGYEFDGVPVNRAFDNYQANSLSNLGQQELQVYTGGSPSGASSATLGGFINQVIKTGTYPGTGTLKGGIGGPGFFHELVAEAGGANPARTFSWYAGLNGYNQWYPFWNYNQGNNINNQGFSQYGFQAPFETASTYFGNPHYLNGPFGACQNSTNPALGGIAAGYSATLNPVINPGVPDGAGPLGGACLGYGVYGAGYSAFQRERNNVLNLHFALPHKNDGGRDDIQLLYDNSMQLLQQNSDINSNGGLGFLSGFLTQFAPLATGPFATGPGAGLCGYENWYAANYAIGLPTVQCAQTGSPLPYLDSRIWAPGTQFGSNAVAATSLPYYFPNSPTNRAINNPEPCPRTLSCVANMSSGLPMSNMDGNWNDVGIIKAQYTKNIGSNAYARLFGYTFYSDWLIQGADCAATGYLDGLLQGGLCGNTADYELTTHTRGAEFQFADQINAQNLVQFTANYTTASVARWNNSSTWLQGYLGSRFSTNLTNLDPNNPICYNKTTGAPSDCFGSGSRGDAFFPTSTSGEAFDPCAAGQIPAGSAACLAGAKWYVTTPSGQGTYNTVKPVFTSMALQDEIRPNSRWDLNLGVRYENYTYNLQNSNNPEFNFWFNYFAKEACYDPSTNLPQLTPLQPGQPTPPQAVQTAPLAPCGLAPSGVEGLHPVGPGVTCDGVTTFDCGAQQYTAQGASSYSHAIVSPRIGGTYTMGPDDVFRFSVGKYTQPTETAFEQYLDQSGKRAAAFDFSRFWGLGFHSPTHDNPVQYSNNFDFSLEHHFKNTDWSMKISPFYRDTHNEIVSLVLGPGFVSGVNVGHKHSTGIELAIAKGDPSRDGWSGQLSYTYTKALVQYGNLPNGTNGIDYLNNYITAFNKLTSAGGGSPCYDTSTTPATPIACPASFAGAANQHLIQNPYFNMSQQGLLNRTGWYPSYPNEPPNDPSDQGAASAIAPHTFSGWLQWKHGKLAIAPNFELIAGTYTGSPTDTYGLDPRSCAQNEANAVDAQGNPVVSPTGPYAGYCNWIAGGNSSYVQSGSLAIPNPYTGKMDAMGAFQDPWIFNMGALVRYEVSPKISVNLNMSSIVNTCFGGSKTPWSTAFKPNSYVCGYRSNNGLFTGTQPGAGFFWGASPHDPANGTTPYAPANNYPFAPVSGANPFQAYLEVQIKL